MEKIIYLLGVGVDVSERYPIICRSIIAHRSMLASMEKIIYQLGAGVDVSERYPIIWTWVELIHKPKTRLRRRLHMLY